MKKLNYETLDSTDERLNEREFNKLFEEVLNDETITEIINEFGLTSQDLIANDSFLVSYLIKKEKCVSCPGLANCPQLQKGYKDELFYEDETFKLETIPCDKMTPYFKNGLLKLIGVDINLYKGDLITNAKRKEVLGKVKKILSIYPDKTKGIYLHGRYGCGKTYILANLALSLSEQGAEVLFAYYPDLVRKMKSLIGKEEFEEIVEELKKVEVLIFDDFGGETPNSYIRDEVLLPILQERMNYNRLTFMSSNLNTDELLKHLAEGKDGIDEMRASRVWERIKVLMEFVELNDENYRK